MSVRNPASLPSLSLLEYISGYGAEAVPLPHLGSLFGFYGGYTISLNVGAYTYTGSDVLADFHLTLDQGSYTYTGQSVAIGGGLFISLATGSYGLNGQAVNLVSDVGFQFDQGSYSLNGQNVALRYGQPGILTVLTGDYDMNGQDVALRVDRRLQAYTLPGPAIGSYTLTGKDVLLGNANVQREVVPYLIGSTLQGAMQMIDAIYCDAVVTGSGGTVVSQSPAHMSLVLRGTFIHITMGGPMNNPPGKRKAGLPVYNSQEGL